MIPTHTLTVILCVELIKFNLIIAPLIIFSLIYMYSMYNQNIFLFLTESRTRSQLQTSPEYGQGMNPISRLAQIQQAKKDKEPEYTLVTERGLPRRREFVMQVLH